MSFESELMSSEDLASLLRKMEGGGAGTVSLYAKKLRARALVLRTQRPHWYLHEGHWHATRPLWVRREEQAR